jgi:hypothetical protein
MNKQLTLLALAAAASFSAAASDVSITYLGKDTSSPVIRTSLTGQIAAGALNYVDAVSGDSFLAYCIEPAQPNALTQFGGQTYSIGSFTGTTATLLQALYSSSFGSVQTVTEQAAFQLAIWEITHESALTLDVMQNAGSFYARSANSTQAAVDLAGSLSTLANNYLSVAQNYQGASLYTLTKLSNGSYQDLIVANPVPEPETYALLLAGLAVIGGVARRRLPR